MHSWNQDGGDRGIYGQLFNADSDKKGSEFLVNTTTAYSQANPAIAMKKDGSRFVVVWESWMQDVPETSGYGIYGQLFDEDSNKIGSEFQVNSHTNNYQWQADVDMTDDGSFIVVWTSWNQDGDEGGIFGQRFDADGNKIGKEFQVNTSIENYQWLPKISAYKDSCFSVVWSSWKQDGSREGIFGQLFNKNADKVGFEFQVNDYTNNYPTNGLISIGPADTKLSIPSYVSKITDPSSNICDPSANDVIPPPIPPVTQYVPTFPRKLTQAELYSLNQIVNNRDNPINVAVPPNPSDLFATIYSTTAAASKAIVYENPQQIYNRTYFGPVTLERLGIRLLDSTGNLVNLHGHNWSFTLAVEQLYQY